MGTPIKFEDIRVGDRVRHTRTFSSGDIVVREGVVVDLDAGAVSTAAFDIWPASGHSFELIDRPAPPEPTALGTVVEFEDELDGATRRAVRVGTSMSLPWYHRGWWNWSAMDNPRVIHEGWTGE